MADVVDTVLGAGTEDAHAAEATGTADEWLGLTKRTVELCQSMWRSARQSKPAAQAWHPCRFGGCGHAGKHLPGDFPEGWLAPLHQLYADARGKHAWDALTPAQQADFGGKYLCPTSTSVIPGLASLKEDKEWAPQLAGASVCDCHMCVGRIVAKREAEVKEAADRKRKADAAAVEKAEKERKREEKVMCLHLLPCAHLSSASRLAPVQLGSPPALASRVAIAPHHHLAASDICCWLPRTAGEGESRYGSSQGEEEGRGRRGERGSEAGEAGEGSVLRGGAHGACCHLADRLGTGQPSAAGG